MTIPEQLGGLSLEWFVALSSRMIGLATAAECLAVARDAGVEPSTWEHANRQWSQALEQAGPGSELAATHRRLLIEALRRVDAHAEPLGFDAYVDINARVRTGEPQAQAFAAHGQSAHSFSASSYEWMDRFARDPRLEVYFQLRVHKAIAERSGRAPRQAGAVYGPGNLVRGRRCHRCDGLKVTRPATAYVYCDYCATLFDYDASIAVADPGALDPEMVDRELGRVTGADMARAHAAGDRDEYGRIARWRSDVSTELCPGAYSPRVRDPVYRRQLVDHVLVPWTVAVRFDTDAHALGRRVGELQDRAQHRPTLDNMLELLEVSRRLWDREAELLEREGVFAAHPDGLDPEHYRYVNASGFVRPWLAALFEPDQQRLLEAAGVACEYVAMPKVDLWQRGCGHCGRPLAIPVGSTRFLCDACGFVLDLAHSVFPCQQCGGQVCMPEGDTDATCAYCQARWTL